MAAGAALLLALFYWIVFKARAIRVRSAGGKRCPHCGVRTAWKSRPRFPDGLYGMFSCYPYRCGGCGCRFYFYGGEE